MVQGLQDPAPFHPSSSSANYRPSKWRGIDLTPGQLITGRNQLSVETGISERSVRTSLHRLKKTGEISIKPTSRFSIITIRNYLDYQACSEEVDQQSDQQVTNDRPANDHIQEVKKEKKRNLDDSSESPRSRPKACSSEQWEKYCAYSQNFLMEQHEAWGQLVTVSDSKITAGAKALDNLIRIQGFNPRTVYETIEWARHDDFWQCQLRSLGSLTKKGRNGEIKFTNILAQRAKEESDAQRHAQ